MPLPTSQQNGTTASTHETSGEALRTDIELQLGRLHINLGRLAAGQVEEQDLALLIRLNKILAIRLNGNAPEPTPPQASEPQPQPSRPSDPTPGEPGGVDAPEPDPEETSEQFHDRRIREIINEEAELKGLTPGQVVSLNIGYIIKLTYGGEIDKNVFHTHFEWLQCHQLFIGRKDNVFEFSIPKPPEAPVFVPSLDDCLEAISRVLGIQQSSMVPLHVNQIGEHLFGHKPSKPELNAMIAAIELHPRFTKQRRTMFLVALEPYADEPAPIPTPVPIPGATDLAGDDEPDDVPAPAETTISRQDIMKLFEDFNDFTQQLVGLFLNGEPWRIEIIRKHLQILSDDEKYKDFQRDKLKIMEMIQKMIQDAGYDCSWIIGDKGTRGRTYTLVISGLDTG
ncbi:MAG TPA: hypothetical protein PLW46_00300, partial [Acinetobacter johnsonii]|nr:hypothetical protein [Acinetobacter johnsonii]